MSNKKDIVSDPKKATPLKDFYEWWSDDIPCVFDKLSPEERNKPQGISCPCPKCTPYC